ncbi:MAG: hypothetical protein O3C40_02360 [Planctomycetota bacterium]|nr:hypothetical protein [Planctomycetota bacterium]
MRDFNECKALVDRMCAVHANLHRAVQTIESELHGDEKRDPGRVRDGLVELRNTLAHHFEEEEADGCLEQAACQCPSLAHDVTMIEHEHPALLKLLDRLISRASRGCDGCSNVDFVESFARLAKTLRVHEAAETRILEQAFGTVVATGETS